MRFPSHSRRNVVALVSTAILAWLVVAPVATADEQGNGAAVITGDFADSCRDFTAHSSKDISYVELDYADGRVVRDETIDSPDYSTDGGPGDEIDSVDVKSGTTTETFGCPATNIPPTAVLEVQIWPDCELVPDQLPRQFWFCHQPELAPFPLTPRI